MTIRIALDLPATATDLVTYAELVADISPDMAIEVAAPEALAAVALVATVRATPDHQNDAPAVEPEPDPVKAPKVAKRAADRKKAAKRAAAPAKKRTSMPGAGSVALAVLTTIVDADGMFDGTLPELAAAAHPSSPSTAGGEIRKMEDPGELVRACPGCGHPTTRIHPDGACTTCGRPRTNEAA